MVAGVIVAITAFKADVTIFVLIAGIVLLYTGIANLVSAFIKGK